MKESSEFGKNMEELLRLLKKILKSQKKGEIDLSEILDQKNVNLNLCFFTFLPLSEDELSEFETELEDALQGEDLRESEGLEFKINKNDLEFLRKNGLKF